MSRARQIFKQRDVTKALKGAIKAGIAVGRVEIDKEGKIIIVTVELDAANGEKREKNEWDGVLQ